MRCGRRARLACAVVVVTTAVAAVLVACGGPRRPGGTETPSGPNPAPSEPTAPASSMPSFDHVLIVVFENKPYSRIVGRPAAPLLTSLARQGANFTRSYAVAHPSQPNYLALFSGSVQDVTDDACPQRLGDADNLGHQLLAGGRTFAGYSEGLPAEGYTGCSSADGYARKHNPWVNFTNVPPTSNLRFADLPGDFSKLPTVSFVVPDMCHDMHDCAVDAGDSWARAHLDAYARWATQHNSLLIVTFDEDDQSSGNQITTLFVGQGVRPGNYAERIDHYSVLRTVEDIYGLPPLGQAARRGAISDVWGPP